MMYKNRSRQSMRKAFTLIELLISITILSIMMVFLYKSYASLNKSNANFKNEVEILESLKLKKRTIFLDFSVSKFNSVDIKNQSRNIDIVLMQTSNSIHKRFNPYIAYIVSQNKLYRVESLKPLIYPIDLSSEFDVDEFGELSRFRVFKNERNDSYIIDIIFKNSQKILLKVKALNEL